MINITKQNSSKLKTQFNLGSELASNVAVYSNMSELNADINNGKYNNLDYSIIFVGTSAYVIKKEDYNNNKFSLQYNTSSVVVSSSDIIHKPYPILTGVNQNNLKISGGMSTYLNNYIEKNNKYAFITDDNTIVFSDGLLKLGEYILQYEDINGNPLNDFDIIGKITV